MLRAVLLILAMLFVCPLSGQVFATNSPDLNIDFYPLVLENGDRYTVAAIGPFRGGIDNRRFADEVIHLSDHWMMNRYAKLYPELVKGLETSDHMTEASIKFVIFRGDDLRDIQATIRVDRDLKAVYSRKEFETLRFPGEKYLGIPIARPNPEYKPIPYFLPPGDPGADQIYYTRKPVVQLGAVELKNVVVAENVKEDFVPLLIYLAEYGPSTDSMVPPVWGIAKYPASITMQTGKQEGTVVAKEYYLTCAPQMIDYYKKLGFSELNPQIYKSEKGLFMSATRESWVQGWLKNYSKRKGAALIAGLSTEPVHTWAYASYQELSAHFLKPDNTCLQRFGLLRD